MMAGSVLYANFAAATAGLITAFVGLLLTLLAPYVRRQERLYFCGTFALLMLYTVSDLIAQAALDFPEADLLWLARVGVACELFFSVTMLPLITAFLLHCTKEDWRRSLFFHCALVIWVVYVAALVAAQFGDAVYSIPAGSQQVIAGPFFAVLVVPPILLMTLNFVMLVRRWSSFTPRQRVAFAIYIGLPLVCLLLQGAFFDLRVVVIGVSLAALAMFCFFLTDQMKAHVRQREEASRRQAQVMALQMRPHFIYNVMTSIYYLCAQDPERAQQVTLDFTDYLRANFASVASEGDVPFRKELEHTRAYLAVESARLEDSLVVDIDCPHMAFRLPPLTLQPLVENTVKHGADPELPPLHVCVATREEPGFSVVTVEDTGPGFDEALLDEIMSGVDAGDPMDLDHIKGWSTNPATALANIRERLAACGASLDITPRQGGGTIATIRVPSDEFER